MNQDDYIDVSKKAYRNVRTYETYHRALEYGQLPTNGGQMPEAKLTWYQLDDQPERIEVRVLVNAVDIALVPDLVIRVMEQYQNDR